MNWRYCILLIQNTILRELRNKSLLFIFVLTIILILVMNHFADSYVYVGKKTAVAAEGKFLAFYVLATVWNSLVAAILGVNALKGDEEAGVLPIVMSLPITRLQYLIARLLGSFSIVIAYYLITLFLAFFVFSLGSGHLAFSWSIPLSLLISSLTIIGMITLSFLLSLFLNRIPCFIVVILLSLAISSSNYFFRDLGWEASFEGMNFFKGVGAFFHYLLPRFGNIEYIARDLIRAQPNNFLPIGKELIHFSFTYLVLFMTSFWVLKKKDIQ